MVRISKKVCKGCGKCVAVCPIDAIKMKGNVAVIDRALCAGCGACVSVCPFGAVSMDA